MFVSASLGGYNTGLYKLSNPDGNFVANMKGESLEVPIYIRTYKLGYKAGKNRVFEYNYDKSIKKSILPENNVMFTDDFKKQIAHAKRTIVGSKFKSSDITKGKGNEVAPVLKESFEREYRARNGSYNHSGDV